MRATELNQIQKLYFSTEDISRVLSISKASAKVTASRYVDKNIITRCKRDIYILTARIPYLTEEELFQLANIIQTPSYISLTTALAYHNLTTQLQRQYIESIAIKRTKQVRVDEFEFSYTIIKEAMYSGFELENNFFIASPAKALADCVYLTAIKRYNCDWDGVNFEKINQRKVRKFLNDANPSAQVLWEQLCENYKP